MVASGYHDLVVAGGVESMSRVAMGSDGGAIFDASHQWKVNTRAAGHLGRPHRDAATASPATTSTLRGDSRSSARRMPGNAALSNRSSPSRTSTASPSSTPTSSPAPTPPSRPRQAQGRFEMIGKQFGLDALDEEGYPQVEHIHHVHHAGNSVGHRGRRGRGARRLEGAGARLG
jgi:acetyl-CoA C-acetyltransferase